MIGSMQNLPLFPVTVVGSWPRPRWLLEAKKKKSPEIRSYEDDATLLSLKLQEDAGIDIVSDGEQRRDNFLSFLTDKVDGFRLMTMADLLEYVEDKAAFEGLLQALDVPAFSIKNPTIVGKISASGPIVLDDFLFARSHTKKPIKVTLPGPYLLSRAGWVKALSGDVYPTRSDLTEDIVRLLRGELKALAKAGAAVVQFDEPVLTELVFAGKSNTRTFMCAALAAQASPEEELDLAVDLLNRVVEGIEGPITAVHVCRGNWSRNEEVLLQGSYDGLLPWLSRMKTDQFVLEYATPRAGDPMLLQELPERAKVGFGVVNPRTDTIESPDEIARKVERISKVLGAERIHLNPDCGFGTFADRPMASASTAYRKLCALTEAARILRGNT